MDCMTAKMIDQIDRESRLRLTIPLQLAMPTKSCRSA